MVCFCRRGLMGAALSLRLTGAHGQTASSFPMNGSLCATASEAQNTPEIRIYGSNEDPRAARTIVIAGREYRLTSSLGIRQLDQAVGEALADILNRFEFGPHRIPGVYFIEDADKENAYAWGGSVRPGSVGTILLGQNMMQRMLRIGGSAVRAILAHEAGHLMQYHLNLDPTRGAPPGRERRKELQVDYTAGWELGRWLGTSSRAISAAEAAGTAMIEIGTPVGTSHGSSNERFRAFLEGFFAGAGPKSMNISQLFQQADDHSRKLVP